jgi:hypothetical protein
VKEFPALTGWQIRILVSISQELVVKIFESALLELIFNGPHVCMIKSKLPSIIHRNTNFTILVPKKAL